MKICVSLVLSFLLVCSPAIAYDNKVILEHDGVQGVWFDESTTEKMLQDLTELQILRSEKIPKLEVDLELHKKSIELYAEEVLVTEQIAEKYEAALNKSETLREEEYERYQKSLAQKDKWYKSQTFAFILGIFTGGLLAVGLAFGLNQGD